MDNNEAKRAGTQLFLDQFEPDGDGYLYRKSSRGAAYRVTPAERQMFIDQFERRGKILKWVAMGAVVAMVLVMVAVDAPSYWGYLVGALAAALFILGYFRLWGGPARALAGRSHIGPDRSAAEAKRMMRRRMSWHMIFWPPLLYAGLLIRIEGQGDDLTHGWDRLWLVGGALIILLTIASAFRKWRDTSDS